ncbi:MAG TPA: glycoside hydrolase family 15 protein [Thermoanaerobaculia bacterium]|nr:glycoside hydrolase family 15 protein [Thermoanaerobaculia bacterium]
MSGNALPLIHNSSLTPLLRCEYQLEDLRALRSFLDHAGTFCFDALGTGLYSASAASGATAESSGYKHAWVRDNVYIAYGLRVDGQVEAAKAAVLALARYFLMHQQRFLEVIASPSVGADKMLRPHVRFDAETLGELTEEWEHAQNDALGYFLWIFCLMIRRGDCELAPDHDHLLNFMTQYFAAIQYWHDEDSGHWEEDRKVSASSIGVVVSGLRELQELLRSPTGSRLSRLIQPARVEWLVTQGRRTLAKILPAESLPSHGRSGRRHDAALLFLVEPLRLVEGASALQIVRDIREQLQGDHGIRRYKGDSYWGANYRSHLTADQRTASLNSVRKLRESLSHDGLEAQWCIFDPLLSAFYGRMYLRSGSGEHLAQQIMYLNRSLGQLTGEDCGFPSLRCPELYFLEQGRYVPNDHTPLLWTQANLLVALNAMEDSLRSGRSEGEA